MTRGSTYRTVQFLGSTSEVQTALWERQVLRFHRSRNSWER